MVLHILLLITASLAMDIGKPVISSTDCRTCLDDNSSRIICYYHQEMYCCDRNSTSTWAQCNSECFDPAEFKNSYSQARYLACPSGPSCGFDRLDFG